MGALGLGVYFLRPAPSRSFPIYNNDGNIAYMNNAYPLRREIVPIWAAALLASLIPIAAFFFMQIRIRSFWDFNNAVFGLLYALVSAAVFQVFVKWLIGGLRPHFLEICQPDPQSTGQTGNGMVLSYTIRTLLTQDQVTTTSCSTAKFARTQTSVRSTTPSSLSHLVTLRQLSQDSVCQHIMN